MGNRVAELEEYFKRVVQDIDYIGKRLADKLEQTGVFEGCTFTLMANLSKVSTASVGCVLSRFKDCVERLRVDTSTSVSHINELETTVRSELLKKGDLTTKYCQLEDMLGHLTLNHEDMLKRMEQKILKMKSKFNLKEAATKWEMQSLRSDLSQVCILLRASASRGHESFIKRKVEEGGQILKILLTRAEMPEEQRGSEQIDLRARLHEITMEVQ